METKKKPFLKIGQALDIATGVAIFLAVMLLAICGYLFYHGLK